MAGHKFLYLTVILLTLAGLNALLPPALAWLRKDGPSFGLHDMRAPSFISPYDPTATSGSASHKRYTIHGPSFTLRYSKRQKFPFGQSEALPEPVAIIEADATEEVVLPDGERIRLRGLRFFPTPQPGESRDVPVEQVFYHPTGRWMTKEEAIPLNQGRDTVFNTHHGMSLPWSVGVILQSDIAMEDMRVRGSGLRDTVTGGESGDRSYGWTHRVLPGENDGLDRLAIFMFQDSGVRPTPMALHLQVFQGEEMILELAPEAPQSFTWKGEEYSLRNISVRRTQESPIEIYKGEPHDRGGSLYLGGGQYKLAFESLPFGVTSVQSVDINGEEHSSAGRAASDYGFEGTPEDIDHIRVRLRREYAYVVFKLPELPIVPESNRQTRNLMEMTLPPVVVQNDMHWQRLLGSIVQAPYLDMGAGSLGPPTPLTFPIDVGGMSVREVLALEHARYPPHEVVIHSTGPGTFLSRRVPGTTLREGFPTLGWITGFLGDTRLVLLAIVGILALVKGLSLMLAWSLHKSLRPRGYGALTLWDAENLLWGLRRHAWKIPPREELATIPGVDVEDVRAVIVLLRSSPKWRPWYADDQEDAG